jgi:hypothetical protein
MNSVVSAYYNPLTFAHEFMHIILSTTPAKALARLWLARTYTLLDTLLNEESWNEEIRIVLNKLNTDLTTICEAITLSEELLALALSVKHTIRFIPEFWHHHTDNSEQYEGVVKLSRKAIEILEEKSIIEYQKLFPASDIAELYYNTFKKIIAWDDVNGDLPDYVSTYLQPIPHLQTTQQLFPDPEVVDSYERCKSLAEKVKNVKNEVELMAWIEQTFSDHEANRTFQTCTTLLIDPKEFSSNMGVWFWTLLEGSKPRIKVRTARQLWQLADTAYTTPGSILIHLIVHESDNSWLITPSIDKKRNGTRAQREAAAVLLPWESLRQQLDEKKGICCPNYTPGRCRCESSWWKILSRSLQWAREDKFGRGGEWKDLPSECTSEA